MIIITITFSLNFFNNKFKFVQLLFNLFSTFSPFVFQTCFPAIFKWGGFPLSSSLLSSSKPANTDSNLSFYLTLSKCPVPTTLSSSWLQDIILFRIFDQATIMCHMTERIHVLVIIFLALATIKSLEHHIRQQWCVIRRIQVLRPSLSSSPSSWRWRPSRVGRSLLAAVTPPHYPNALNVVLQIFLKNMPICSKHCKYIFPYYHDAPNIRLEVRAI